MEKYNIYISARNHDRLAKQIIHWTNEMVRSFSRGRQIISTSDPLVVMFCVSNYKQRRYEQQTKKFLLSAFI